ncbi:YbjN domain-containing protein [Enterovirga sp.]|uniref:YbjN domain-containing protein n=1 Tax=Enterovirga sp. TaxID=2026350 RepID=UPI002D14F48A|nr:YbjN domain-containing protein [Enterovirga sp.]HMO30797.1 YbjN domain-containing protein [Enterovirga sp.]
MKTMALSVGAALAGLFLALSSPAEAQIRLGQPAGKSSGGGGGGSLIDGSDPAALAKVMQELGYFAKLSETSSGRPKIESKIGRKNFGIYFYDCKDNKNCKSISFSTGWEIKNKRPFDLAVINKWNSEKRFGQAFVDDDGDPNIAWAVVLSGGISRPAFEETLDYWQSAVTDFEKMAMQ